MVAATQTMARGTPAGTGPFGRLAGRAAGLSGWRRPALLALLGALATPALPPLGILIVLLPSLAGLIWCLDGARSWRAAFAAGWWWGWGWYGVGFYWIGNAMLVDPERFGWMIPFATLGLGAVQAVFLGGATLAAYGLRVPGVWRVVALAGTWTVMEWVRSWFLTGFPWNPLGSVWDAVPALLQLASVFGVYGLCAFTILVFGLVAVLADFRARDRQVGIVLAVAALVAVASAYGAWRLSHHPTREVAGVRLRLVQASIAQRHMWREDLREAQLLEQIELSRGPGFDTVTHMVWPETAAPFFLDQDPKHRALATMAIPYGGLLLTGAPRVTPPGDEPFHLWNSLMAIDGAGRVLGTFDKVHLVPFGEYVPLRAFLPLPKMTAGGTDFSPGDGLKTLDLPGLPSVGPFICYEAVFPGAVVGRDQPRPAWLLTVTNDAWFGRSAGPHQHLAAGRMRAVEEGLPLVRSANSGISAIIDPLGREIARLGINQRGVLDGPLPQPVDATPYARLGNKIPLLLAVMLIGLARLARRARVFRA